MMTQPGGWDFMCEQIRKRPHKAEIEHRTGGINKIFLGCSCGEFQLIELLLGSSRYSSTNYSFIERYLPLEFALHLHREHAMEEERKALPLHAIPAVKTTTLNSNKILEALGFPAEKLTPQPDHFFDAARRAFDADPFRPVVPK